MKKLGLLTLVFLISCDCFAQKKLIQKLLSNEKDTVRRASFMPIPVFGYAQETGFEFGLGSIYSFYVDKNDRENRSTNLMGIASYSTKGTYNFKLTGDTWTKGNTYHILSEIRFKRMPFNFYGIGNNTAVSDEDKLVQQLFRINIEADKAIAKNVYTGVTLSFENQSFKDKESGGIFANQSILDKDGGKVLFFGVSQTIDSRNSNNYPTKGFYGRLSYQYALPFFGDGNFKGGQLKLNLRNFWSLTDKIVLGAQALYTALPSDKTPFYLYPQMGNDEMMRGYYTGRFRDKNYIASQLELRYRFLERFGAVAFAGTGKVFNNDNANLKDLKPNYGIGGRYFFDPAKGLSIRVDYGIGEKRANEKRQTGMYISFAEAF